MPGSDDRLADMPPGTDQVSPREPDPAIAELRERMERLPPGHPSSPYHDDGSRRPLPDLSVYELPVPGDPDYRPDVPRASEAEHARDDIRNREPPAVNPLPEQELPDDDRRRVGELESREQAKARLSQILDRAMERCRAAEGRDADGNYGEKGLTPAMCRIESQLEHGHLADQTEEHALKGHVRFKEKLAERVERFPNAHPDDLAAEIHDGVRYTFILDYDYYTEGVDLVQTKLAEAGYDHIETKPGWHGEEYKGVNSQWGDHDSGIRFEVQFHTSESWTAKQVTHEAYETIRANQASVEETESLRAYQREVSAAVRIPPGALDIPAYKRGR